MMKKKEWEFKLEQFRAQQKRESEQQKTNRAYISACRDVAVTYYKNRPRLMNYYTRIYAW